jgi:hypothetical protein
MTDRKRFPQCITKFWDLRSDHSLALSRWGLGIKVDADLFKDRFKRRFKNRQHGSNSDNDVDVDDIYKKIRDRLTSQTYYDELVKRGVRTSDVDDWLLYIWQSL